jgi:hypothetical protein
MFAHHAKRLAALFILLAACTWPRPAAAEPVVLPLTIDYQLLTSMVATNSFNVGWRTAVIVDEYDGCRKVTLAAPQYSFDRGKLRFETKVFVHAGAYIGGSCRLETDWEGYVVLYQQPRVDPARWVLSFDTYESQVLTKDRQPTTLGGIVWEFVKGHVYDYLGNITMNLAPPVADLKAFLLPLFPPEREASAQTLVNSMQPGRVFVDAEGLHLDITAVADTESAPPEAEAPTPEELTEDELDRFVAGWESWDAFLITMLTALVKEALEADDRQTLLDVLLETRYRFLEALAQSYTGKDFVRDQFIWAWQQLSPVFRNNLGDEPSATLMGYLAFFTASDALIALDRVGPALGIEISRDGLVRLAKLIADGEAPTLAYDQTVDPSLRKVLGLGEALSEGSYFNFSRASDPVGRLMARYGPRRWLSALTDFLCPPVYAAKAKPPEDPPADKLPEIKDKWLFTRDAMDTYLKRVRGLVADNASFTLMKSKIPDARGALFKNLAQATAWQESCYRQFKGDDGTLSYLRSYNGTSVGLMQINERVWRGLYDSPSLRWDIGYNAKAGCEVLEVYITRYALRNLKDMKDGAKVSDDDLAGAIYAMYNGGPGQFDKFLERRKSGKLYDSDKLFLQKWNWVTGGKEDQIVKCLVGG